MFCIVCKLKRRIWLPERDNRQIRGKNKVFFTDAETCTFQVFGAIEFVISRKCFAKQSKPQACFHTVFKMAHFICYSFEDVMIHASSQTTLQISWLTWIPPPSEKGFFQHAISPWFPPCPTFFFNWFPDVLRVKKVKSDYSVRTSSRRNMKSNEGTKMRWRSSRSRA